MGQVAAICESAYIGLTTAGELTDKPPGHNKRQDRRRSDTAHVINILAVGRTADGATPDDVRVHLSEMLVGSIPAAATKHWRGRDAARRSKTVKTASVYCFTHSIYSYYWGALSDRGSSVRLV